MATEVASIYARVGADMTGFNRGMTAFNSGIQRAGGMFRNFTTGIVQGIGQAFGNASLRMIRDFGDSLTGTLRNAANMEQGIADIASVMGATADQTKALSKLVTDLGIDPKLKVTATQAASAIEVLAKNGLKLDDILGGAARSTVLLSNSTGGDFATSADVATSAMAQFKIRASDMAGAVNQIVGVTRTSKFDINDYRLAISQAGGVAASVGVSFDDFNATIADIAPLFASGSDAGTSFKTFLQRLVPDSEPAKEMMRALGLLTRDGTNAFFDAQGQMKSMAEVAGILEKATQGLSEEQKISAFSTIFGTDAMRAAFALADGGAGSINKLKTAIGNTSAEESAATRMNTLKGDWEIFQGILETLSIQIGQKFLPNARGVVQWATELATRQGPALVEFFGRIANMMPGLGRMALGFFDTISGPGVTKMVSALMGALSALGQTLATLVRPFKEAFQGLFTELAAMRGVGIVDIFKVIVRRLGVALSEFGSYMRANAIPFVREQFGKFRDQLYDFIRSVNWWEETKRWAAAFWEWSVDLWNFAKPYLLDFWNSLSSWVTDPTKRQQLLDAVVLGWNVFSEWAGKVWTWMEPGLTAAWGWLSSWVTDPTKRQQLLDAVVLGWNVFSEWAGKVWTWMEPGLTAAWGWLSSWVTDPTKRQQLWEGIKNTWDVFTDLARKIREWLEPELNLTWEWLKSWITDPEKRKQLWAGIVYAWNVFTDWANSVKEWLMPGLKSAWTWLTSWITDPEKRKQLWQGITENWDVFTGFALSLVPGIGPGLSLAWFLLKDWVTDPEKRKQLSENVNKWRDSLTDWAKYLWEGGEGFKGLKPILEEQWALFKKWLFDRVPTLEAPLSRLKNAFPELFSEIEKTWGSFKGFLDRMGITWEKIAVFWTDVSTGFVKILTGIVQWIRGWLDNDWKAIWDGTANILKGVGGIIGAMLDFWFPDWKQKIINGLLVLASGWTGLSDGMGRAMQAVIDIFNSIMDGFNRHVFSVMRDIGQRIIDGITEGIKAGQQILKDALNWVTSVMPDWVKNALGIRSPSTVFAEIGKNISAGLAKGIEDNVKLPELSVQRMVKTTIEAPRADSFVTAESIGGRGRLDIYLHADTQLPTNRQALREIIIGLQRELQFTGARVSY